MDASDSEVHDTVSDEKDGDVAGDVLLVGDGGGEPVLQNVVKEINAEERGDPGGVQGQIPEGLGFRVNNNKIGMQGLGFRV